MISLMRLRPLFAAARKSAPVRAVIIEIVLNERTIRVEYHERWKIAALFATQSSLGEFLVAIMTREEQR